jgi:Tfp pilus assembly protein PilF
MKKLAFCFALVAFGATGLVACSGAEEKKEEAIKNADWHYKMGAGYFESKEIALSIRELTTAIEMNPEHTDAHFLLGFVYFGRRDYQKALNHLNEALRLKPDFTVARNNRGALFLAMERWGDAEADFLQLLDTPLYPTPELAHNNVGWAYYNQRDYNRALEHYKMAVFLKPSLCVAHNNMGLTYLALNARLEASESFQSAIDKCPENYAEPHLHLGKMMLEDGHPKARAEFERCYELEPESTLGRRCRQYLQIR